MLMYTRPAQPEDFPAIWAAFQDGVVLANKAHRNGRAKAQTGLYLKRILHGWGIVLIYDGQVAGYGSLVPGPEEEYEIYKANGW